MSFLSQMNSMEAIGWRRFVYSAIAVSSQGSLVFPIESILNLSIGLGLLFML